MALLQSEERYRTTLASIGDAVISTDIEGRIAFMNAAAEKLTGWAIGEAAMKPATLVFNIINEQTRRQVESPIAKVLREGTVVGLANHTILVRKDGTEVPVDDSGAPIRDGEGKPVGVVLVFHDITERLHAEKALRESEERFRLAQQAARVGTFEWNLQTDHDAWTPELEALYGLRPGEFAQTGTAWAELIHPEDRANVLNVVQHSIQTGELTTGEWRVVWPGGSVHWLAGRWQTFKDASGQPLRMTGVNMDITERKQAEEQVARSQKTFSELVERSPFGPTSWIPSSASQ